MKKIPTLFERVYENHKIVDIKNVITTGCEEAFEHGLATVKLDGSCCAIINGEFYKRYDCKKGKIPPEGAIPCCDPDPITGHWPHWVKVDPENPADKKNGILKMVLISYVLIYIRLFGLLRDTMGFHLKSNIATSHLCVIYKKIERLNLGIFREYPDIFL